VYFLDLIVLMYLRVGGAKAILTFLFLTLDRMYMS